MRIYAVYFDYEKDETKPFSYFIGCRVDENPEVPENLESLEIPSQNYVRVIAKGAMTECITKAWEKIWDSEIQRKIRIRF